MTLAAIVATQIGNLFAQRTESTSIWRMHWGTNRLVWVGIATELALMVVLVYLLAGRTVNELTLLGEIHVAAMSREGRTFLPTLGTVFREGDLVHLVVQGSSAARLTALLGEDRG